MAIPIQGCTVTWGTATLTEVKSVEVDLQRGSPQARTVLWTLNLGNVKVLTFGVGAVPDSEYGKRRRLIVKCPQGTTPLTIFDSDCIYQDRQTVLETNGVLALALSFRVMDTAGAPSNP
jgi:hypothetical protein